ncbi:MAG: pilus assembly protein N-terminal domain-containing protein [Solirubrobacterales bacterium]
MNARILALATVTALAASFPSLAQDLRMAVGQVSVVTPGGAIGTVVIGDPKIADVAVDADASVMVFGRAPGQTDLVVFNVQREIVYKARVAVAPPSGGGEVVVRSPSANGVAAAKWFCGADGLCRKEDAK